MPRFKNDLPRVKFTLGTSVAVLVLFIVSWVFEKDDFSRQYIWPLVVPGVAVWISYLLYLVWHLTKK